MSSRMKTFLILQFVLATSAELYQKRLSKDDPAVQVAIKNLSLTHPPMKVNSVIECGGVANAHRLNPDSRMWATSFLYTDGICYLGRVRPFVDALTSAEIIYNQTLEGIFMAVGNRPTSAEAHSDVRFYVLVNEEEHFDAHANLDAPNIAEYDGLTKRFEFDLESPVQTLEGRLAGRPINNAFLDFQVTANDYWAFTALAWFYAPDVNSDHIVLDFNSNMGTSSGFYLKVLGGGQLFARVFRGLSVNLSLSLIYVDTSSAYGAIQPNTWNYIGVAWSYVDAKLSLYINGSTVDFTCCAQTRGTGSLKNLNRLVIGYRSGSYLKGYVASVEVYDRYLNVEGVRNAMAKSTTSRVQLPPY